MLAKVISCAVVGLDGALVDVEVDVSNGQPGFTIVGLPDAAVQESRERVRAAIKNSNFSYPYKRITARRPPPLARRCEQGSSPNSEARALAAGIDEQIGSDNSSSSRSNWSLRRNRNCRSPVALRP